MAGIIRNRLIYGIYLAALLAYSFAGFRVYRLTAADKDDERYEQMELFARVLERVRRDYVDGDKLTYKDLVQGALRGMLSTLDPHSEFLDLSKFQELKEDTEGAYGGIGLQVGVRDGSLTVIAPMEDSPAFNAGILPGDRILQIDGKMTERLTQGDAIKKLRGDAGSKVTLTIGRNSLPGAKDFELTREDIRISTVKDVNNRREFPVGDDHIGYVRITQFGDHTSDELEEALNKLEKKGMRALVVDLRGNPGGLLDQAVAVCEKFLERGKPIVSTEARSPANEIHKKAAAAAGCERCPWWFWSTEGVQAHPRSWRGVSRI
jgi:carboxyl-terminal processing protease